MVVLVFLATNEKSIDDHRTTSNEAQPRDKIENEAQPRDKIEPNVTSDTQHTSQQTPAPRTAHDKSTDASPLADDRCTGNKST